MQSSLQKCKNLPLPDNVHALLVTNPTNVQYLTGLQQDDERAFLLLCTQKKMHLLTSPLHAEQLKKTNNFKTHIASKEKPYSKIINDILVSENVSKLHFESTDVRYSEHLIFKKNIAAKLLPSNGIVEEFRMVKKPEELRCIRIAMKASLDLFLKIENSKIDNLTEQSVKVIYDSWLQKNPEFSSAFTPIIAADAHAAIPHYTGYTKKPIKNMILIDWGLEYKGYKSDFTRILFTKNTPKKMKDQYKKLQETLNILVRAIHESPLPANTLYEMGVSLLKKHGLDKAFLRAGHALGHGVGLDIHENPHIISNDKNILKKDMAIALEPAAYFPKRYGLRIEDTIIV